MIVCIGDLLSLSMFLLIPTWACYRRADDGVRSPTDNVPKWVEMVTGRPFWEISPVKGKGRVMMVVPSSFNCLNIFIISSPWAEFKFPVGKLSHGACTKMQNFIDSLQDPKLETWSLLGFWSLRFRRAAIFSRNCITFKTVEIY